MIDICDFAVGLSRQLHGLTIASERPGHRLMEQWHPLGPTGVITAFNFPVAVWSWNAALAVVCGNPVIWKPSDLTPLTAIATSALFDQAAAAVGAPAHLSQVVLGGADVGAALVAHPGVPLISATGSTRMGQQVAGVVAGRFGRSILELGGNNAAIVAPSADIELVVRGMTFAAAGTAGQRCTSLRRAIVHNSRIDEVVERMSAAYATLPVGSPLDAGTLGRSADHLDRLRPHAGGHRDRRVRRRQGGGRWRPVAGRRRARRRLRATDDRDDARADRHRRHRDVRAAAVRARLRRVRRSDRAAERRAPGSGQQHLHHRRARGRAVLRGRRQRLRHRQRQHRAQRRRDRRSVRRREGHRRRPRERQRRMEGATCAARPTRSTTPTTSPSPRASSSADRSRGYGVRRRRRRLPVAPISANRPLRSAGR